MRTELALRHYHGTPMGGKRDEVARWIRGRHVLIPFARSEDLPIAADCSRSFAFDNSAFTAWKSGSPIHDWSAYFDWVDEWSCHPRFDWAIIPDKIDGTEKDNDALLAKWYRRFVPPRVLGVPVWHLHESLDRLRYLARNHHLIALGSSGQWPTPGTENWWVRMGHAMSEVCDEHGKPMCKLHGLRMLSPDIVSCLPFASADSTNVAQNSELLRRFGMYCPPTQCQRMAVIADRIESVNSPAVWSAPERQMELLTS